MEINYDFIKIQNPLWDGWNIKYDAVIEKFDKSFLKYYPKELDTIDINQDGIYGFYGARGVGKTTLLKLFIRRLIDKEHVNKKNIFYYSCHNINTFEQLNEVIKIFISARRLKGKKSDRLYIAIDEITLIKNWEKGIEHLRNAKVLKSITFLLTGSVLPHGKNSKKYIKETILSSLSFGDFVDLLSQDKEVKDLDYYLDIYLLTGGFLSAINSYRKNGYVHQDLYNNYLYWQVGDVAKIGRDVVLFRQILEQLIENNDKPIGYKTIARKTKARTHVTVGEYVEVIESMFAVCTIYQIDKKNKPIKSKQKKIIFRNPFLFWVFYAHIYGSLNFWQFARDRLHNDDVYNRLISIIVFNHLIKIGEVHSPNVMFWRNVQKKQEIDFVVKIGKKAIPILNRHNQEITGKDKEIFFQAGYKNGIIIGNKNLKLKNGVRIITLINFLLKYKGAVAKLQF